MLINSETGAINNLLEKNLKKIRGRVLVKKSDDKDLQSIVNFQEEISKTTGKTNRIDTLLETHNIQQQDIEQTGSTNNELGQKEDIISELSNIKSDVLHDVDNTIATKESENQKLRLGGLTAEELGIVTNNETIIKNLQSKKKVFIEQVSIVEQKYQNDIDTIKKSLAQKIEVTVGINNIAGKKVQGLENIPINLPNISIEAGNIPLLVADYTTQQIDQVAEHPLFQGQPQENQLTKHLTIYQRFDRLQNNTSTPLSSTDITTIKTAQDQGRPIPFEQDATKEEKELTLNTLKTQLRDDELKPIIGRLMLNPLKPSVAETTSNNFIAPINQAGQDAHTGAFDISQARYDAQGNLNMPRKIIPILGTVQTQNLSTNNGNILYPHLCYNEKNKTFVMQNQAIEKIPSFGELATQEASIITPDMITKALKSDHPQKTLTELYTQANKKTPTTAIESKDIASSDTITMITDCLLHGHHTQNEFVSSSPTVTPSPYKSELDMLSGKSGQTEALTPQSNIYPTIESFSKSMKGRSLDDYNKFSSALPVLGQILKDPSTEKNIENIIQNNPNSPNAGVLATLSESHRSTNSLADFFRCFTDPTTNEFKLNDFVSTIESLDFSINQGGGLAELKYSGINNNFIKKVKSEYTVQHDQQEADQDLDDELANIDNDPNTVTTFA